MVTSKFAPALTAAVLSLVAFPAMAQGVFLGSSETFESPPVSLSSSFAGGSASTASGLNAYTASANWDDFYFFDNGIRVVSSGQGAGGSNNYLYIPIFNCASPHFAGLQTNHTYSFNFYAASGSTSPAAVIVEFGNTSADFDILTFTSGGTILTGFNGGSGTPTTSGATLANADVVQWNLGANAGYSTSALDSNGIPWQQYAVTFKYTGTAGTLDFNISADDPAGTLSGAPQAVVIDGFSAVPEPASALLVGVAAVILRFRRGFRAVSLKPRKA
jgi:hypothetical protein